jgi:hypothetical protein
LNTKTRTASRSQVMELLESRHFDHEKQGRIILKELK